jgi:hypothetical protein
MGLATTYIVATFAVFVFLLSFILSSYGGQVTTRSSSHPKDGKGEGGDMSWPPPTLLPCLPSLCPFSPSFSPPTGVR